MARGTCSENLQRDIDIIFRKPAGNDDLFLRINDPVFTDTGLPVFAQLYSHVSDPGGRGEDLQYEIRSSMNTQTGKPVLVRV